MNISLHIGARYLFSKKTTNAINIITWISIVGMSIGSAALILILSVFNGFESLLAGMLDNFNPDIKVNLVEGKHISKDSIDIAQIQSIKGIEHMSFTIEETSFFNYNSSQEVGVIKGVDQNFMKVSRLDTAMIMGAAQFDGDVEYGVIGTIMNTKLSVNPMDGLTPITAYMPSQKAKGPLAKEFNALTIYPSGVFYVGSDVDAQYILVSFDAVNNLMDLEDHFSSIEISLTHPSSEKKVMQQLTQILGPNFKISNRYQQDEGFLRIMNIEKWISYLIACLTMLIIAFNLVGSLWMIVLEKKKDIAILRSMGMTKGDIRSIFFSVGLLVTLIGLIAGFVLGLIFYFMQSQYGLISFPAGSIISSYPIELRWIDFVSVTLTVVVIGFIASILPSKRAGQIGAFLRQE